MTADSDCSHEIKRCLLLGRKVMTNLDSLLKSRDITLPTKVHLVKAVVFPVVMYGYESWTIKIGEHQRSLHHPPAVQETRVRFLGWKDPLENGMATHSSVLAWRIPCTEEPGGLHGVTRVGHD